MEIYYAIQDHGDGSAGVRWFKSKATVRRLVDADHYTYDESWFLNEGGYYTITLPDDTDLSTMGLRFYD